MQPGNPLAQRIEHTLLKPDAKASQVANLVNEALTHHFFGVCVNSSWVPAVKKQISESSAHRPKIVAVVGFPLGAASSPAKAFETEWTVKQGADEIDMVIHIGHLKDKNSALVVSDIQAVVKAAGSAPVKVIIETGLLTLDEKKLACELSMQAGAHFVKTCTGFAAGVAEVEDVRLMRSIVGSRLGVKASGGIKTTAGALALVEAGADRLGTSSGPALLGIGTAAGGY